jgi:hypothetical protein
VKNYSLLALFSGTVCKFREWLPVQPFSFTLMKKFLTLFLFILLLIVSEYFLVNELLSYQRLMVLLLSLVSFVFCTFIIVHLFRKAQE